MIGRRRETMVGGVGRMFNGVKNVHIFTMNTILVKYIDECI